MVDVEVSKGKSRQQSQTPKINLACTAAQVGDTEALLRFFEEDPKLLSGADADGRTPLHHASAAGKDNVVQFLVDKGMSVNTRDENGWTPLISAASSNKYTVVKLLLEKGAKYNEQNDGGRTALHYACSKGLDKIVQLLVQNRDDLIIDASDQDGMTPLFRAVIRGSAAMVRYLIENGANIQHQNKFGETPLHLACQEGHEAIVTLLIDHGADPSLKDKKELTPADYVTVDSIRPILRKAGPSHTEVF